MSVTMHRQLEVVPQDTSVVTVAARMRTHSIGSILVRSFDRPHHDCRIAGIVTRPIWSRRSGERPRSFANQHGGHHDSPLITIAPNRPMVDASHVMQAKNVRHLVVTEGRTCSA